MFLAKVKKSGFIAVLAVALLGSGLGVSIFGTRGTSTAHAVPIPADRPAPRGSEPVEKDGLSVTVTPAKAKFTSKDPLAFTVTLKNVSREPFMLFDSTDFWAWKIKAGDWQAQNLRNDVKGPLPASVVLEPGKSIETVVKLDDPSRFEYRWTGEQEQVVGPKKALPPGKYPLVVVLPFKEDGRPEQRANYKHRHWTGEIASRPIEIEVLKPAADISWGEPKNGIRLGLSPRNLEVAEGQKSIKVKVWYDNVTKDPRETLTFQGGNMCSVMFAGTKDGKQFYVDFAVPRLATTPARKETLKPGESFSEEISIPFDGTPGTGFAVLPRPAKGRPLTLAVGLCAKMDTNGKASWDDAATIHSGNIAVAHEGIVIREGQKELKIKVGEKFDVRLENVRPQTGWETTHPMSKVVEFVTNRVDTAPDATDRAIGTYTFTYKAATEGKVNLTFMLIAPGGPGVKARYRSALIREFVLTVEVEK